MGVTLPSDLIADVMRSADPSRVNSAVKRLQELNGDPHSGEFQAELGRVAKTGIDSGGTTLLSRIDSGAQLSVQGLSQRKMGEMTEVHVAFERMVLRNLLESLLPDSGTGAFGSGPSAGVWRSLAADQLAGLYANNGGIGIAATLSKVDAWPGEGSERGAGWPYFSTDEIVAYAG